MSKNNQSVILHIVISTTLSRGSNIIIIMPPSIISRRRTTTITTTTTILPLRILQSHHTRSKLHHPRIHNKTQPLPIHQLGPPHRPFDQSHHPPLRTGRGLWRGIPRLTKVTRRIRIASRVQHATEREWYCGIGRGIR